MHSLYHIEYYLPETHLNSIKRELLERGLKPDCVNSIIESGKPAITNFGTSIIPIESRPVGVFRLGRDFGIVASNFVIVI